MSSASSPVLPMGVGGRAGIAVPNTLGVACFADDVCTSRSAGRLLDLLGEADAKGVPVAIVGQGSNIVLRARLPGVVVRPLVRGIAAERLDAERWRVTVGAGETWQEVVRATLGKGIRGLENLILVPGLVGAAPVQNIGAYGRELSDVLESVAVIDRRRGALATLSADDCQLRYRSSVFKAEARTRYVIVSATFVLGGLSPCADYPDLRRELSRMGLEAAVAKGDRRAALQVAEAVARVRRRKLPDPRRIGNVGSFFKNPWLTAAQLDNLRARIDMDAHASGEPHERDAPYKVSAARLIDVAGWKGVQRGQVQVWPRQPLVLVNHGGASGRDVLEMARRIRDDVAAKFGVALELEPTVLGVD